MIPLSHKILLTGVTSIHGWPLFSLLRKLTAPGQLLAIRPPKMTVPEGNDVRSLCITDEKKLTNIRESFSPTHVIHAAGVCDLDVCEERPLWAHAMNVIGTEVVAKVFGNVSRIIYLSADLVFSGNNPPRNGYGETDAPDPLSVAGKTFAAAEKIVESLENSCTLRLGLPLGASVTGDKGAIDFIDSRMKRGLPMTLFHDEFRSCIRVETISDIVIQMLLQNASGLYNLGGDRSKSLYDIGRRVLEKGGYSPSLLKSLSRFEEINGPPRMGNVALNSGKIKSFLEILSVN